MKLYGTKKTVTDLVCEIIALGSLSGEDAIMASLNNIVKFASRVRVVEELDDTLLGDAQRLLIEVCLKGIDTKRPYASADDLVQLAKLFTYSTPLEEICEYVADHYSNTFSATAKSEELIEALNDYSAKNNIFRKMFTPVRFATPQKNLG